MKIIKPLNNHTHLRSLFKNLPGYGEGFSLSTILWPPSLCQVNWAFRASPAPSGLEDDEGWHSDGPALGPLKSNRELQELVSRVASLENQIRSSKLEEKRGTEEGKSATWPG